MQILGEEIDHRLCIDIIYKFPVTLENPRISVFHVLGGGRTVAWEACAAL